MAIHIQSGKNHLLTELKTSKIHNIPFKIHADCDAKVSKYFETSIKKDDNEVLSASFRGYPLKGKIVKIPDGYKGVVLHETTKPIREKDDRQFFVVNNFDTMTYWNWDKIPCSSDDIMQALQWIDIAEALHSPITEE